jgi:hypothetical protein
VTDVKTQAAGCSIKVNWSAPQDGGSSILGYKLDIINKAGVAVPLTGACGNKNIASRTSCVVPMTLLVADPINLTTDDIIYV